MCITSILLFIRELLLGFNERLVERLSPEEVILFGSLGRCEASSNSDADILMVKS